MTLADIPAGEVVFVDANIFIFYFRPDPVLGPSCDQFLRRIETGDIHLLPHPDRDGSSADDCRSNAAAGLAYDRHRSTLAQPSHPGPQPGPP